jgi:hypothetical protein
MTAFDLEQARPSAHRTKAARAGNPATPALVTLQQSAGNAAVSALVGALRARDRPPATVQRTRVVLDGQEIPGTASEDSATFHAHVVLDYMLSQLPLPVARLNRLIAAFMALQAKSPWDLACIAALNNLVQGGTGPQGATGEQRLVISGHGDFNENRLETEGRKKLAKFPVPPNVRLRMFAPDGAALDNTVANEIEKGTIPNVDTLELVRKDNTSQRQPMTTPFPREFGEGEHAINYTVSPPDRLTLAGSPITVGQKTSLKKLLDEISKKGGATVDYACCSSSYSQKAEFKSLFTHAGWYVRFKH